ncbi:MAG: phosphoribosylaminoimidazolesuccinocarboxamide synthase [Rhodospirillaceae bacterium]|nr:phosphoribosylaminoimidazolesuccinocarboxamide synthase [Rhodospirillaceae bacterium]|tara:strand:- start:1908 stop:2882 length:975 start_codon:yes stop_codon:yes gene_type:complete
MSINIVECLTEAFFPELPNFYSGKVRDSYDLPDGRRVMISTDRQSAFDQILAAVPYKGQVLNQTARFWFEQTVDICPNHVLSYPDKNVLIAKKLQMLPVEMVVRDYLTGSTETSIWPMYKIGNRNMYGLKFPDDLIKNQKLPKTIVTPTTKAAYDAHDKPISPDEIIRTGLLNKSQWKSLKDISLALFARGREIAAGNGLILVDTKYEFGLSSDGCIVVADEIHTPDSSRYWYANSYKECFKAGREPISLDKEFLRLWITKRCDPYTDLIPDIPIETVKEFSNRYIHLYERVTGQTFENSQITTPIIDRIRKNLSRVLPEFFAH